MARKVGMVKVGCVVPCIAVLGALGWGSTGWALPGAHAPSVATFDTRGSTVVVGHREGLGERTFRVISYNANFASTSGNFSAQFGAHYVQFQDVPNVDLAHGAAASGVGLWSFPLTSRYDNGVPGTSIDLYFGAVPTATVSGLRNFLTAPLVLGTGLSLSPTSWLTLTPWIELGTSVNWDTYLPPEGIEFVQEMEVLPNGEVVLRSDDIAEQLEEAIRPRVSFHAATRAGVQANARLSETWALNGYATYLTLGSAFRGAPIAQAGGGVTFHWDELTPAVLPASRRLARESCEDVEQRFRECPRFLAPQTSCRLPPASSSGPLR